MTFKKMFYLLIDMVINNFIRIIGFYLFVSYAYSFQLSIPDEVAIDPIDSVIYQNGIPIRINGISSHLSIKEILSFYKREWAAKTIDGTPSFIVKQAGEWSTISTMRNGVSYVVQIKDGVAGTEGFISKLDLREDHKSNDLLQEFPRITGSEVLSFTESSDDDQSGLTLVVRNNFSLSANRDYYLSALKPDNWALQYHKEVEETYVMFFIHPDNKHREISLVSDGDQTLVVINQVER